MITNLEYLRYGQYGTGLLTKKRKLLQYVHGRLWSGSIKVSGRINSKDVASGQVRGDELQLQKTQAFDRLTTEEEKGITDKAYPPLLPTLDPYVLR